MNGWRLVLIIAALLILAGVTGIHLYSSGWDNYSNNNNPGSAAGQGSGNKSAATGSISNPIHPLSVSFSEYMPLLKDPKPAKTPKVKKTPEIKDTPAPSPIKTPQVTKTPEPTATALASTTATPSQASTPVPTPAPSLKVLTDLVVYPESQAINSTVNINYNVSGAGNISLLITYPNGTAEELLNTGVSTSYHDTMQFKITQFGEYTAKIMAGNPAGNTSSSSTKFYGMEVITASTRIPAGNTIPVIVRKDMVLEVAANDTASGYVKLTAKIAPSNTSIDASAIALKDVKAIKYIRIDAAAAEHISNVTLKINYSAGEISGLDESTLGIYYRDNVSNVWYRTGDYTGKEIPAGPHVYDTGMDTAVKYVWAGLDRFGVFALAGKPPGAGSTVIPSDTASSSGTTSPSSTASGGGGSNPPSDGGGGSSSGGGGGGGTSGEDYTNIEKIEKYEKTLYKDKSTNYQFSQNGVVDSVNITGNVNLDSVNVIVEVLRDISSFADSHAPGLVYRNVNIWVGTGGFATPRNIKEATITFRVDRTWLASNNISDVVMYRYTDGEWVALPTMNPQENEATGNYAVYRATTDRFSPFSISGVKGDDASARSTRQSYTQKQSPQSAATAKATPTKKAQSSSEEWGAAMTVALVGIVAAALAFIRKKMM